MLRVQTYFGLLNVMIFPSNHNIYKFVNLLKQIPNVTFFFKAQPTQLYLKLVPLSSKSKPWGESAINYLQGKRHDASFNICSHFRVQSLQMSCPLKIKSNWSGCTTRHRGNEAVCHCNRLK